MEKAKKLYTEYGKFENSVTYEYRGNTYNVYYSNCLTLYHAPAYIQHKDAQERIDRQIEAEAEAEKREPHPFDLDEVFKTLGWD